MFNHVKKSYLICAASRFELCSLFITYWTIQISEFFVLKIPKLLVKVKIIGELLTYVAHGILELDPIRNIVIVIDSILNNNIKDKIEELTKDFKPYMKFVFILNFITAVIVHFIYSLFCILLAMLLYMLSGVLYISGILLANFFQFLKPYMTYILANLSIILLRFIRHVCFGYCAFVEIFKYIHNNLSELLVHIMLLIVYEYNIYYNKFDYIIKSKLELDKKVVKKNKIKIKIKRNYIRILNSFRRFKIKYINTWIYRGFRFINEFSYNLCMSTEIPNVYWPNIDIIMEVLIPYFASIFDFYYKKYEVSRYINDYISNCKSNIEKRRKRLKTYIKKRVSEPIHEFLFYNDLDLAIAGYLFLIIFRFLFFIFVILLYDIL